jgi:hypothetical protein
MLKKLALILVVPAILICCQKKKPVQNSTASSENFNMAVLIYADRVRDDSSSDGNPPLAEACIYALNIDGNHPLAKDTQARLKAVRPFNPMPVNLTPLQTEVETQIPQVVGWLQIMRNSHKSYPLLLGTDPAPANTRETTESQGFRVGLADAQRFLELASMHLQNDRPTCPRNIEASAFSK